MLDNNLDIRCIVAIVERGKADKIVTAAKKAGAGGATIFYARGTGESEALKFFNLNIEASKEVIIILTRESERQPIYDEIIRVGKLDKPGTGVIFTVPVDDLAGLHHRKDLEND